MRAGQLDRQITVERKLVTQDPDYGTEIVDWIPLVDDGSGASPPVGEKFWAEVQDVLPSHSEAVSLGLNVARSLTRIRMRHRDDIDSSMRVRLHGDGDDIIYQIVAGPTVVVKEGRKTLIEFMCERYSS